MYIHTKILCAGLAAVEGDLFPNYCCVVASSTYDNFCTSLVCNLAKIEHHAHTHWAQIPSNSLFSYQAGTLSGSCP